MLFGKRKEKKQQDAKKKQTQKWDPTRNTKRILLAEDDFGSRRTLDTLLSQYGSCDVMMDGEEAVNAFVMALEEGDPYVLICLGTTLPVIDGYQVLKEIRSIEEQNGIVKENHVKAILIARQDFEVNANPASESVCDMVLSKPIAAGQMQAALETLGLF